MKQKQKKKVLSKSEQVDVKPKKGGTKRGKTDTSEERQERPRKKQKIEQKKTIDRPSKPGASRTTKIKKTTRTVIIDKAGDSKSDHTPPRALITQWLQIQPTANWALICKNYPNIEGLLKTRLQEKGSVFLRGRKPNRVLRCVWKYCVHNDPKALEDAIELTTPIPRVRAKKVKEEIMDEDSSEDDGVDATVANEDSGSSGDKSCPSSDSDDHSDE